MRQVLKYISSTLSPFFFDGHEAMLAENITHLAGHLGATDPVLAHKLSTDLTGRYDLTHTIHFVN